MIDTAVFEVGQGLATRLIYIKTSDDEDANCRASSEVRSLKSIAMAGDKLSGGLNPSTFAYFITGNRNPPPFSNLSLCALSICSAIGSISYLEVNGLF